MLDASIVQHLLIRGFQLLKQLVKTVVEYEQHDCIIVLFNQDLLSSNSDPAPRATMQNPTLCTPN